MNAAFQKLCAMLTAAGVPDARFDAAELYRFATGRDPRLDDGPSAAEAARLSALAERRPRAAAVHSGRVGLYGLYAQGRAGCAVPPG